MNVYQPVSSLRGVVVITSALSVKIHWYTPASDKPKLVIWSSLDFCWPPGVLSVMVILLSPITCSPFLTHTTEGGLELPEPTHLNTWLLPTDTAVRLSGKPSLSARFVTTVSVLVLAAGKKRSCYPGKYNCHQMSSLLWKLTNLLMTFLHH